MEPQQEADDLREQSRRLTDAARQLKRRAEENIEASAQRLERARNTLQASWLVRALRKRLQRRDA
jgi:hypothetical protein